jgi:predicted AAA+ superfamily ATPase
MIQNSHMRYLVPRLREDLLKKMVLLAGPRQCGKTTLAKSLLDDRGEYLNWDITKDRKLIRELAWPKDASLVVLDELHKAPKKLRPHDSLQLVLNLDRAQEKSGIKILPLGKWLEELPFDPKTA